MLATEPDPQARRTAEPIVVWASADGTRCVLATVAGVLELRIERDGVVIRRAHYLDIRPACEAARQWQIDWDMDSRLRRETSARHSSAPSVAMRRSEKWTRPTARSGIRCRSCGDVWLARRRQQLMKASARAMSWRGIGNRFGATPLLLRRPVVLKRTSAYGRSAHSG